MRTSKKETTQHAYLHSGVATAAQAAASATSGLPARQLCEPALGPATINTGVVLTNITL